VLVVLSKWGFFLIYLCIFCRFENAWPPIVGLSNGKNRNSSYPTQERLRILTENRKEWPSF
jgi:hypothetical protein